MNIEIFEFYIQSTYSSSVYLRQESSLLGDRHSYLDRDFDEEWILEDLEYLRLLNTSLWKKKK